MDCVNSTRVDFALMDPDARVVHAIEYQGSGHHQGTAAGELKRLVEKLVPAR